MQGLYHGKLYYCAGACEERLAVTTVNAGCRPVRYSDGPFIGPLLTFYLLEQVVVRRWYLLKPVKKP